MKLYLGLCVGGRNAFSLWFGLSKIPLKSFWQNTKYWQTFQKICFKKSLQLCMFCLMIKSWMLFILYTSISVKFTNEYIFLKISFRRSIYAVSIPKMHFPAVPAQDRFCFLKILPWSSFRWYLSFYILEVLSQQSQLFRFVCLKFWTLVLRSWWLLLLKLFSAFPWKCIWVTFHEEDCLCIHHADAVTATDTVVNSASAYSFILTLGTGTTCNICEL